MFKMISFFTTDVTFRYIAICCKIKSGIQISQAMVIIMITLNTVRFFTLKMF